MNELMDKKTERILNKMLICMAIISFVIAMVEGFFYYEEYNNILFRFLLMLQNSIKAFGFRSTISLEDMLSNIANHPNFMKTIVGYAYGAAYFVAPFCTMATLYKIFDKLLRFNIWRVHRDDSNLIIIFGYNEDVKTLLSEEVLKERKLKRKIHLVISQNISSEEELQLLKKGIVIYKFDCLKASGKQLRYFLKTMKVTKAKNIILFEESSSRNFSIYHMFHSVIKDGDHDAGSKIELSSDVKFFCRCEDVGIKRILEDFHDTAIKNDKPMESDLEIVSIPELQVREMLREVPIHSYYMQKKIENTEEWHVHLLVLGFGAIGQQFLLQTMNLGVVHSQNHILIDVIDYNMEEKMNIFVNRFSSTYFKISENEFILEPPAADGKLCIRFHKMDIRYHQFQHELDNLGKDKFTYVAICLENTDVSLHCMVEVQQYLQKFNETTVPVVLRMDYDVQLANYIRDNQNTYRQIYIMENRNRAVTLDKMLDANLDKEAKEYGEIYNKIRLYSKGEYENRAVSSKPGQSWKALTILRRDSNRALAHHEEIMQQMKQKNKAELQRLLGVDGKLLEKKDVGWIFEGTDKSLVDKINDKENSLVGEMARMEHRRWCYFMASRGWKYAPGETNELLRTNPCMVEWMRLCAGPKMDMCKYDLMPLLMEWDKEK